MNEKYRIFLLGGNSLIGNSILKGIQFRYKNNETISVIRSGKNSDKNTIKVSDYRDFANKINNFLDESSKNIFILSFGILNQENSANKLLDNLSSHIRINAYDKLFVMDKLKSLKNTHEIHIVSSILSGFFRPSIGSYSISKYVLSKSIDIEIFLDKKMRKKIFLWNPAYVDSNLNKNRKSFLIKTSPIKIEKAVRYRSKGGEYYIPRYSVILVKIASFLQSTINKLDK
jgi:hypothetical protein